MQQTEAALPHAVAELCGVTATILASSAADIKSSSEDCDDGQPLALLRPSAARDVASQELSQVSEGM